LVNLPEGRMKSREGTIVDADNLMDEVQELVKEELKSRYKLPKKELVQRGFLL
jgi:arginyl-tRNA synthetase